MVMWRLLAGKTEIDSHGLFQHSHKKIFPTENLDHTAVAGAFLKRIVSRVKCFFKDLWNKISSLTSRFSKFKYG
jgi:hypothetical protein